MSYTTLGRTGLRVSVAGLGCGGFSRLGQGHGSSVAQSIDVVRAALDAGVNFLDTAEHYRTEDIVGQALKPSERDQVVISTKTLIVESGQRRSPEQVVASLHASLKRLRTERVEVFHLHAVTPKHVDYAVEVIAPALLKERDAGRIAHLGITESGTQRSRACRPCPRRSSSGLFDVVMVAFHLLHQNARDKVFPLTRAQRCGDPADVRGAPHLQSAGPIADNAWRNWCKAASCRRRSSMRRRHWPSLPSGRVRWASSTPPIVMRVMNPVWMSSLFGTGNIDHLKTNIQSILADPLPPATLALVRERFSHLVGVGLDAPDNPAKTGSR